VNPDLLQRLRELMTRAPADATAVLPQPERERQSIQQQAAQVGAGTIGAGKLSSSATTAVPEPTLAQRALDSVQAERKKNLARGDRILSHRASPEDYEAEAMGIAGAISPLSAEAESLIPAWHASKSDMPFPKFSREFFSKGAGGDAMGQAVYATNAYPEALEYLKAVSNNRPSYIHTNAGSRVAVPPNVATELRKGGNLDDLLAQQSSHMERVMERASKMKSATGLKVAERDRQHVAELLNALQTAQKEGIANIDRPGTLFQLGLDVDKNAMLNFDKDLLDQSPFVQDVLRQTMDLRPSRNPSQMIAYNALLNRGIREPGVAAKLEDAGLQGGYRSSPMIAHKSTNYAVFNPDRAKILQALGMAGMLTGGGVAASRSPFNKEQ